MSIKAVVVCMVLCTVSARAEVRSDTLVLVSKGNPDTLSMVQSDAKPHAQVIHDVKRIPRSPDGLVAASARQASSAMTPTCTGPPTVPSA